MNTKRVSFSPLDSFDKMGTAISSGDIPFPSRRFNYNIGNYEICVLLDNANRFLGIESIKIHKNFYDPTRLPTTGRSVEEIVDEFFRSAEE